MKIPFNQIKFENIYWDCFDECDSSNEDKLQMIVNQLCDKIDWTDVDLKCLFNNKLDNPIDILNLIINKLCSIQTNNSGISVDLSKLQLCIKDNHTFEVKDCLEVTNTCNTTITLEAVLQDLISRINRYSYLINQLNLRYEDLSQKYNSQQIQINNLITKINNCCP